MLFRVFTAYNVCGRLLLTNKPFCYFTCYCSRNSRLFCDDFREKQNLYEVLGISRTSNANEIKSAYYKLSFIYHPDKNIGDDEAVKRFQEIRRAYEILGNNELKQRYDRQLTPRSIGDNSAFAGNKKSKVEWLEEDYTTFYRKRKEGRFRKPVHFSSAEKNYGSYFTADSTDNLKRQNTRQQTDYEEENIKKYDIRFLSLVFTCGIWIIIMLASLFTEEKKSPPKQ